ncbi:MAG: potassium/proton antiporter [Bryobacterales bacterium]|nr:potassium/proton antiporter [Bryobacterales bacterium]
MTVEHLMLGVAVLLLASVIANKASGRFGVPALLVFLVVGMLAGSDGPGGVDFYYPWAAQSLGIVALALILFAGGLDTHWPNVRPVLRDSLLLSTLGVALTAVLVAVCSRFVLKLSWLDGLLLGSIVSSTDAAAVFGILRSKRLSLPNHLRSLLEFESGSNDPMAVFLTVGMIALISRPEFGPAGVAVMFVQQMVVGGILGFGMGKLMVVVVNRLELEYEGLYPAVTLALVLLTYGLAAAAGGNGFLAVYLAAIVLGNSDFLHKRSLVRFHDGLAWLMQIAMFLTLGLQVFPSRLPAIAAPSLLIAAFLIFLARPIAVLALLLGSRLKWRERLLVSWVGLRGAAPIVLATFPLLAGIEKAGLLFDVVFFVVLASALLQGTTVGLLAGWLGLAERSQLGQYDPLDLISNGERDLVEVLINDASRGEGKRVLDLGLPAETLLLLVNREGRQFMPRGATVLQAGDIVLALAAREQIPTVRAQLSGPHGTRTSGTA